MRSSIKKRTYCLYEIEYMSSWCIKIYIDSIHTCMRSSANMPYLKEEDTSFVMDSLYNGFPCFYLFISPHTRSMRISTKIRVKHPQHKTKYELPITISTQSVTQLSSSIVMKDNTKCVKLMICQHPYRKLSPIDVPIEAPQIYKPLTYCTHT